MITTTLGAVVRVIAATPHLGEGSILRFSMLDDDRSAEVYLTPEEQKAVGQMLGCYTQQQVEDLQRQLAEATGQVEAAKQATREIMAERNTWARQLADMRDERNTAREETEKAREMYSLVSNDRDSLHIAMDELVEKWRCGGDDDFKAHHADVCPGCNRANQLRRVIARWEAT